MQLGAVHLRDRRGGQRLHIKAGKNHLGLVAQVCAQFRNSMLLKCAGVDPELARTLLRDIPLRAWNMKTLRGFLRMLFRRA
ncbi:hypothetical protein D9M69_559770 [compost metagenome]